MTTSRRLFSLVVVVMVMLFAGAPQVWAQINQAILNQISTMTFQHQAGLNTFSELNYIKQQAAAGVEPWASNYSKMANAPSASLTYTPSTWATGTLLTNGGQAWEGINDVPDDGGTALIDDSNAAYTQALMWEFTGNPTYAQNAIKIMNAWSYNLKTIGGQNWYLIAGWSGCNFPVAAEIIRNTYSYSVSNPSGWTSADIAQFTSMLNNIYLPLLNERYGFGNREFVCCNALCAIGVFNNDRAAFYQGVRHWMSYLPCYIYMTSDGAMPPVANYWATSIGEPTPSQYCAMDADLFPNPTAANCWILASNAYPAAAINPPAYPTEGGPYGDDKTSMLNGYNSNLPVWTGASGTTGPWGSAQYQGVCGETLRDLGHVENSISEVFDVAEMARVQGFDLYSGSSARLAAFLEMNSYLRLGNAMPGGYTISQTNLAPTYENGYNHLVNVLGLSLPYTQQLINPIIRGAQWFYLKWGVADYYHEIIPEPAGLSTSCPVLGGQAGTWETLTHGNLNSLNGVSSPGPDPNVALGRPVTVSATGSGSPSSVTDGNLQTFWSSARSDPQWCYVDLGMIYNISGVTLYWNTSQSALSYMVQTSTDAVNWTAVYSTTSGAGGVVLISGLQSTARYVRMYGTARNSTYGYGLYELQVFGTPAIPTSGLVAWYQYEQDTIDSSGMGNNGTAKSGFTYSSSAIDGAHSGQFNGTGARVVVADNSSLDITENLTLATWVNVNSYANNPNLIAKSFNNGYRLRVTSSGVLELLLGTGGTPQQIYSTNLHVTTGVWTHVAATVSFNGTTATVVFYLNGMGETHTVTNYSAIQSTVGPLVLGIRSDADSTNEALNGLMDETAIYKRALSSAEIVQLYNE